MKFDVSLSLELNYYCLVYFSQSRVLVYSQSQTMSHGLVYLSLILHEAIGNLGVVVVARSINHFLFHFHSISTQLVRRLEQSQNGVSWFDPKAKPNMASSLCMPSLLETHLNGMKQVGIMV
jgi:hypothetical protein